MLIEAVARVGNGRGSGRVDCKQKQDDCGAPARDERWVEGTGGVHALDGCDKGYGLLIFLHTADFREDSQAL